MPPPKRTAATTGAGLLRVRARIQETTDDLRAATGAAQGNDAQPCAAMDAPPRRTILGMFLATPGPQ